jgi:hypothetical protein
MKYIYYIVAMVFIAFALFIFQFFAGKPDTEKNPAIIINDRVITVDELAKIRQAHDETRLDFINTIITKELMIQEAQRSGIDREEAFRRSIQNFYEQSLVKTLMDRKFASLNITVTDEEVDRYYSMLDKKLDLTVSKAASSEDMKQGRVKDEKINISFGNLSGRMKSVVFSLKKGEKSLPFVSGSDHVSITLDNVQPGGIKSEMRKDDLRRLIAEEKREQMITEWLEDLRKKAKIKVTEGTANGG